MWFKDFFKTPFWEKIKLYSIEISNYVIIAKIKMLIP